MEATKQKFSIDEASDRSVLQQRDASNDCHNCDSTNATNEEGIRSIQYDDKAKEASVQSNDNCPAAPAKGKDFSVSGGEPQPKPKSKQTHQSAAGSLWSMLSNAPQQTQQFAPINTKTTPDSDKMQQQTSNINQSNSALSRGKNTVANILGHFRRYPDNTATDPTVQGPQKQDDRVTNRHHQLNERTKSSDCAMDSNSDNCYNNDSQQSNSRMVAQSRQQQIHSSLANSKTPATMQHQQTSDSGTISHPSNRFVVRYLGSSILHKNFTLPMLEWIAKDIKRQTIKGAKTTSQRQITIPARDIVLEIQSFQLKGSSCKDGHCIFVHPMQHVSKYAQLQHDPNCFSYLIRDYKDSPYTCHVFQAKHVKRVHDIFTAVREATTRSRIENPATKITSMADNQNGSTSPLILGAKQQPNFVVQNPKPVVVDHFNRKDAKSLVDTKLTDLPKQFENSYQFEVMFVKKVKLQCRRVPSTFVDDAMETLKSFEVLKNTETKTSGLGKRIISVSVDERQEYDENISSPTPTGSSNKTLNPAREIDKDCSHEATNERKNRNMSNQIEYVKQKLDEPSEYTSNLNPSPQKHSTFGSTCSLNIISDSSANLERPETSSDDQKLTIHKAPLTQTLSMDSGSKQILLENLKGQDEEYATQKIQKSSSQSIFASTLSGGYNNDFSPYNTITSVDVNNQIAGMPVMSSSVSLDHETRQKLARQIREKLMETASNLSSSKNSINRSNEKVSLRENNDDSLPSKGGFSMPNRSSSGDLITLNNIIDSSAEKPSDLKSPEQPPNKSNMSNFDLFRRASTRQVVKNRTMLLLIGKDELCTISTDHHQVLFNKSFNCIVHCLQGTKNNDHFGLICRDSGKINPNTESYAGFIFKCQSDKVVREVMAAMKQVIHNSHHNFYSYNSPYNPLNTSSTLYKSSNSTPTSSPGINYNLGPPLAYTSDTSNRFAIPNNLEQKQMTNEIAHAQSKNVQQRNRPNPIRSMFCDDCPLHWYHRLCCDLESMPPEASKAIILRRLDTSFSELEQDEVLSKFSEFKIETIDEHNDIFMSLLRHLCEKKQSKHNQSQSHISAMASYNNKINDTSQHNEASPSAMDNLIKAKKSISASIENILKRRSSFADDLDEQTSEFAHKSGSTNSHVQQDGSSEDKTVSRQGSFRRYDNNSTNDATGSPPKRQPNFGLGNISKINDDYNPLAGLFRRRSSTFGSNSIDISSADDKVSLPSSENVGNSNWTTLRHSSSETRLSPSSQSADELNKSQDNIANRPPVSPTASKYSTAIQSQKNQSHSNDVGKQDPSSPSLLTSTFWKKSIYEKIRSTVITDHNVSRPSNKTEKKMTPSSSLVAMPPNNRAVHLNEKASHKRRSSEEIRYLWKKAIDEQITLIKMDKQNKMLQVQLKEKSGQEVKLNYKDLNISKLANAQWDKLLLQDPTMKVDFSTVSTLVKKGVPHSKRGEVWMFLMNQYQLRHGTSFHTSDREYAGDANQPYRNLLTQLSLQQHEIFVDLGRTFPNHPYYSQFLGAGQLSLFNLLKAYSLLDPQVGYCQGLSFVAGILLLHVNSEDEAFELMRHLLFNYGLRKQYLPSMNALQLQLYQLTRLLRDFEYEIFRHFDNQDISPSLYAAPWFLTLFASQFPLSFTARLFDLLFLHGIEAIFRISISLLSFHRDNIVKCYTLESTMKYIKTSLMNIKSEDMVKIFDRSLEMDLRTNLIDYEIEYTFYCAHDSSNKFSSAGLNISNRTINDAAKLEKSGRIEPSSEDETTKKSVDEPSSVVATAAAAILQQLMINDYNQAISISTQD